MAHHSSDYSCELVHYGVPGMKWGVRKSKAQRDEEYESKWRKKEVRKIAKRRLSQLKREDKSISKRQDKYNRTLDKYGPTSQQANKAAAKYVKTKSKAIADDEIAKAEVKKIMSMKISDIKAENRKIGEAHVKDAVASLGTTGVMQAFGVPFAYVRVTSNRGIKTNNRVPYDTQRAIRAKAYAEAFRDVAG